MSAGRRPWRLAGLVALALLAGCAVQEPDRLAGDPPPAGVHSIFVLGHGYHAGLAVRARDVPAHAWPARRDFPEADYLELGWGDREYYPRADPGLRRALQALFVPSPSTLHVVPVSGGLTRAFPRSEIIELHAPSAGFAGLVEFVHGTHEFDAAGRAIIVPSDLPGAGRFYASPRPFHAFENCNVWVARALRAAGIAVDPHAAVTAGMLLHQVRPLSAAAAPASHLPGAR